MVALIRLECRRRQRRKPSWAISGARFGEIAENANDNTDRTKVCKPTEGERDNGNGLDIQRAARLQIGEKLR